MPDHRQNVCPPNTKHRHNSADLSPKPPVRALGVWSPARRPSILPSKGSPSRAPWRCSKPANVRLGQPERWLARGLAPWTTVFHAHCETKTDGMVSHNRCSSSSGSCVCAAENCASSNSMPNPFIPSVCNTSGLPMATYSGTVPLLFRASATLPRLNCSSASSSQAPPRKNTSSKKAVTTETLPRSEFRRRTTTAPEGRHVLLLQPMSLSTSSHHFCVLKLRNTISTRKRGKRSLCASSPDGPTWQRATRGRARQPRPLSAWLH